MSTPVNPFDRAIELASTLSPAMRWPAKDADEAELVETVLQSVRPWASSNIDSSAIDAASAIPKSILSQAAEQGLFGLSIPERFGGAGLSMSATSRVVEEIACFDRSVATAIGLHCGLGTRGLIHHAHEALQQRYLPDMAAGTKLGAFAATEAGAGSHIASVKCTGIQGEDGKIRLNGEKIYVTNGGFAQVFTVVAKTPGLAGARNGWSIFALDRNQPGLSIGREEHKLGIKGSSTITLLLDDVAVDPERIIGEPSQGLAAFHEILAWGRTMMAGGCVGTARAAFRLAVSQATTREQFGHRIARFGMIRRKIADMSARLHAMETVQRLVTLLQDLYQADIGSESSVAKIFNSEGSWQVADDALQVHGGLGYIEETGVARMLRDARITRIFEGANEVLRFNLSSLTLSMKPTTPAALLPAIKTEALHTMAGRYDALSAQLVDGAAALRKQYGMKVFEQQVLLEGLADGLIARMVWLSVLLRADGEFDRLSAKAKGLRQLQLEYIADWATAQMERASKVAEWSERQRLVHALSDAEYELLNSL
ncbi:MAG: acyl-CoA dehydrogenase family protein [Myxococcota bacterium]|jgi:alkylation response protein AidB-like acyl-CoA dehydrogenase|nr:acyl-CoA dehydrogenase family protein [Myxococcota bacterium]